MSCSNCSDEDSCCNPYTNTYRRGLGRRRGGYRDGECWREGFGGWEDKTNTVECMRMQGWFCWSWLPGWWVGIGKWLLWKLLCVIRYLLALSYLLAIVTHADTHTYIIIFLHTYNDFHNYLMQEFPSERNLNAYISNAISTVHYV